MVSEIVALEITEGFKTSSRIDPAQILKNAGPVFRTEEGQMTVQEREAKQAGLIPLHMKSASVFPRLTSRGPIEARRLFSKGASGGWYYRD
jgi:hypothetical protein